MAIFNSKLLVYQRIYIYNHYPKKKTKGISGKCNDVTDQVMQQRHETQRQTGLQAPEHPAKTPLGKPEIRQFRLAGNLQILQPHMGVS
jgi:hypothetical protein